MAISLFRTFARRILAPALAIGVSATGAMADFRGGGVVFGFEPACAPAWPADAVQPTRIRYSPSELNPAGAPPSEVTIAFPTGTEHFTLWGPMLQGPSFLGGAGRQSWTRFVFYDNRPLLRIVSRNITARVNAGGSDTIPNAQELLLRLRIQNFGNIPGCAATITATLRRN